METKDVLVMLFAMLQIELQNQVLFNSDNIIIKTQNDKKIQISIQKE